MIVKTQLAEQAEQFQIGEVNYVGRRVQCLAFGSQFDVMKSFYELDEFKIPNWKDLVLFKLDYDRGEVFVDPAILRPYHRPERKEEAGT